MEALHRIATRLALPRKSNAAVTRPPRSEADALPSVSVVIPCYNYGRYLAACIDSVLEQPGVRAEVIVVDDASPDATADIVQGYAARDPRVRVLRNATNRGHIATYNRGLAEVRGDYTVLLSADDLLTPGCLERATRLMEEHPSVGLVYGFPLDFTDAGVPPARVVATSWIIWQGHSWIKHACSAGRNVLHSPEAVIRTSVARQIGGYRANLPHSGDLEMWLRAAAISDVGYIVGADQAYYRLHPSNMHRSFDLLADVTERLRTFDIFLSEHAHLLPDAAGMGRAVHKALAREALRHAISAYARGVADAEPIDDFAVFAVHAHPEVQRLAEWKALSQLRSADSERARRTPWLLRRELTRNFRYSLGWWRRRWAGID